MRPPCFSSLRSYILNPVTMRCCHEAGVWIIRFGGAVYMAGWRLLIYGIPLLLIAVVQLRSALLQCTIY